HVDDADRPPARQLQPGEAQVDRQGAVFFFLQAVGVDPGEPGDESGLAMVHVPGRADDKGSSVHRGNCMLLYRCGHRTGAPGPGPLSIAEVIATELRPWIGKPPVVEPPQIENYRLIRTEQLDLKRVSILGLLLVPVWMVIFSFLVSLLSGQDEISGTISIVNVIVGLAFIVILVVVHEIIHGLAVLASGKMPSFGAGPGFFYTTCHEP